MLRDDDPYQPPASDLSTAGQRKGALWKAVGIAAAVDILGTNLLSIIIVAIYTVVLLYGGMDQLELERHFATLEFWSPLAVTASLLGLLISVIAGYLCARIANHAEYRATAFLALLSGAYAVFSAWDHGEMLYVAKAALATIGALYIGAWLYVRKKPGRR